MSGSKQISVHRTYEPAADACIRAVELLLTTPCKVMAAEPAPEPDGRDGTEIKGDSADEPIIRDQP